MKILNLLNKNMSIEQLTTTPLAHRANHACQMVTKYTCTETQTKTTTFDPLPTDKQLQTDRASLLFLNQYLHLTCKFLETNITISTTNED